MLNILVDEVRIMLELPDELIDERFYRFEESKTEKSGNIRGTIKVTLSESDDAIAAFADEKNERLETEFAKTVIYQDKICCLFKEKNGWNGLIVTNGQVRCIPEENMKPAIEAAATLFDYMKGGIFLLLKQFGYYVLHSSSLIVNNKVIAFSAESGVGKTTHTQLWEELYNVSVFNGDMIMIDSRADSPKAIGIPWSGSTGITTKEKLPLTGIFFIERGNINEVREISDLEKLILLTQRMLSVNYDHRAFLKNAESLKNIACQLKCARLICLPDEEAAVTAHKYVEENNWI